MQKITVVIEREINPLPIAEEAIASFPEEDEFLFIGKEDNWPIREETRMANIFATRKIYELAKSRGKKFFLLNRKGIPIPLEQRIIYVGCRGCERVSDGYLINPDKGCGDCPHPEIVRAVIDSYR